MKYKVGQEVVIKRNLGAKNGREKKDYYHGGDVRWVPLGTKGVVERIDSDERVKIQILDSNRNPLHNYFLYVNPDEIGLTERQEQDQRELGARLESVLLSEEPSVETQEGVGLRRFEPKFNVREEFAVWVREQFPELIEYAQSGERYVALEERRKEVMKGAKMAYEHAIRTTENCARASFVVSFGRLSGDTAVLRAYAGECLDNQGGVGQFYNMTEEDWDAHLNKEKNFKRNLDAFVRDIERASVNLNSIGPKHHGIWDRGGRKI